MVIGIFGESCTGKSTLAESLKRPLLAGVYAGKDYLRLAPQEETARAEFAALLRRHAAGGAHIIYIAAEPEQLALLPESCLRVKMTAPLDVIKARFSARTGGKLPPPVEAMLERKHGCFDTAPFDLAGDGTAPTDALRDEILSRCGEQSHT